MNVMFSDAVLMLMNRNTEGHSLGQGWKRKALRAPKILSQKLTHPLK